MRSKRVLFIFLVTAVLCAFTWTAVFATSNFIIRDYDIRMVVNEDDTYEITETIDVEFTARSHGIYRKIPLKTRFDRDGQVSEFKAQVYDFKMLSDQPVDKDSGGSYASFKIGSPDVYADTYTRYQFSYVYDTGGDHFRGGDEVYLNMVGDTWEAQNIDHVSFEIIFPENIDMSKVGVKTGNDVKVAFESPDARTVRGETSEDVMRGLTVRAVLPEGYFTREAGNNTDLFYRLTGALVVLAIFGILMWRKYGRDPVYPVTPEFYPPDNISAPEAAYLLNETLDGKDVVSMLLSLADKGYLVIHEHEKEDGRLRAKKEPCYSLEKIRDYDGGEAEEKMFMDGLFRDRDRVEVADLKDSFYKTIEAIEKAIKEKYRGKLYDEIAESKAWLMYIAGVAGLVVLNIGSLYINDHGFLNNLEISSLLAPVILEVLGAFWMANSVRGKSKKLLGFLLPIMMIVGGSVMMAVSSGITAAQRIPFALAMACCILMFVLGSLCEKKTEYYAQIQSRIKGYMDFLRTAEKDQMEMLAYRDPGYYYRNLAYAFALGVTAVYAKRFAGLAAAPPGWYDTYYFGTGSFNPDGMLNSITHMTDSVSKTMTSSPSDGSGGGSFSGGGGGGGGGGGAW